MRRLVRPLVFTALAAACQFSFAATGEVPTGKLPRWAVPQSYALSFRVDPAQTDFSGTTVIRVQLKQASDFVWLHGKDLSVKSVEVTDASGRTHAARYRVADAMAGVARVEFGRTMKPQPLTVTLRYSAPLNRQLQGLYKVTHEGRPYAMTQMEPISARYAFPGFDEPDFKTPYTISLTIPDADVGVANTTQTAVKPAGKGWKTLTFAPTPPLPTYLVAFGVGPWDVVSGPDIGATDYRKDTVTLRGIAAHGEGHRMQRALDQTPVIVETLEDYYGFGYPFGKLDLLAAPDFSAGAMENPGLVTFRDWLLLLDADSPARYVRRSFNVTAHELAHQWTGDTVTMRWWDDLWLNEAFATWMQQKITQKVHPEYRADLDRVRGAQYAMRGDSLVTTRKIRQPITGNGDIETAFDGITYQKGAAVLGMFEGYVGEKTFQKGMRAYIADHRFGNATATDLVDSIANAADRGAPFKAAFMSFLNQPGVPYVQTRMIEKDGVVELKLTQSRYFPVGSKGDAAHVWGVPLCVRYGTADGSKVACELFNQPQGTMKLPGATTASWVMPNANAAGYYRFSMDKADLGNLGRHAGQLDDAEQLAYADAVDAAFRRGDIDAGDALAALKPLAASKVRTVATAPMTTVGWMHAHLAQTPAQREQLQQWMREAYLPRLERLGYQRRAGESDDDSLMRSTLAGVLALDYRLPAVRAELLRQGSAAMQMKDGQLKLAAANPDLLGTALGVVVQERGASAVAALIAALPRTTDPASRNAILSGLASAEDPALLERVRNFALNDQVKVGEMASLLRGGRDTRAQRDAMWAWSLKHYDRILARTGSFAGGRLPGMMGGGGCSAAEAERLQGFFARHVNDVAGAARGLAQTSESIRLCAALKSAQDPRAIIR